MPGKRISDLTALTGAGSASIDDLVIFDTDAAEAKRITRAQLATGMVPDLPLQYYLGVRASAPTQRLDGTPLQVGDYYADSATKYSVVYSGTGWSSYAGVIAAQTAAEAAAAAADADRVQTGLDRVQTGADRVQTSADRVQTGVDRAATQTARVAAELAETNAETARDAAFVNANVFANTTDGLAAVALGGQFQVVSGSEIIRYREDAGPVATEIARYPGAASVSDLQTRVPSPVSFSVLPPESGWLFAVRDAVGNISIGVDLAGKTWFTPRTDLTLEVGNLSTATQQRIFPSGIVTSGELPPESGFVYGTADALGRVGFGVKPDGTFWAKLAEDIQTPSSFISSAQTALLPSPTIEAWGDSMTAGAGGGGTTYTGILASALSRTVNNQGIGGQNSAQIAARQGGLQTLLTVTGNQIPASGAVAVTARTQSPITSQGAQSFTGTLAGVAGTLSRNGDDSYTFTRAAAGSIVSCPAATVFLFDVAVGARDKTVVIWSGRNDAKSTRADHTATRDNILSMLSYLSPPVERVLVVSVCNGAGEGTGTSAYNQIAATNAELQRTFGDRYIDLRRYLVDFGLADAGISPTAQDTTDVAADTIPASLRADNVHFTAAGYTLVGNFIARQIRARGW